MMSAVLDVAIILNNYLHDVATAVLLSAAVIMWVLEKQTREGSVGSMEALARAYPALTRFAQGALAWIVVGGIPRIVTFNSHDLGAVRDDLVPVIVGKHVVEVAAVLAGAVLWMRVRRRIEGARFESG
ncbi:MAG: hypothetical protein JXA36_07185 [Coriobacteriia bacterium]|nr:hypothetical protein [Coriobacteriia bacterium]